MGGSAIAAQLYTLRAFTQTPADLARTLARVRQIGYEAVQVSAIGPIAPAELARMLRAEGLVCCATHTSWERMRDRTDIVIEEHRLIGCEYPAIGGLPQAYRNARGYHEFARECSAVARKLKAAGLTFGYHNHSFELEKFDGRTGLQILVEESDGDAVTFEIDTYWIQHGGGDPAAWIAGLAGRCPLVHLKDMAVGRDNTSPAPARFAGEPEEQYQKRLEAHRAPRPIMAEVGEGNLNWRAILDACRRAGTRWYIVEQDVCQRDPFESLAISLRNLRAMGVA